MGRLIRSRGLLVAVAILLGGGVGYSIVDGEVSEQQAEMTAQEVAQPLARLCEVVPGEAAAAGADCAQAVTVARDGTDGRDGRDGANGRGVLGTSLTDGRLVVTFDDGTSQDVGQVAGPAGVGITTTAIEGGRLVVSYSDGQAMDVGPVVGPAGRGIASLDGSSGRLLVTLTDGDVLDAGPLPAGEDGTDGDRGPAGDPGPPGPTCPEGFQPVETGEAVGEDGTRYSRSITCVDPASGSPPE